MRVQIKPAHQIQRINQLLNELSELKAERKNRMTTRPNAKSWSVVEVMKHMEIGHKEYCENVKSALEELTESTENVDTVRSSTVPSRLIKMFPPKEGRIRFKMKTGKKFKPVLNVDALSEEDVKAIQQDLENVLIELKSWVEHYRSKAVSFKRFNSAIGPIVRFNVPEACEFILCHNERHFQQIHDILSK